MIVAICSFASVLIFVALIDYCGDFLFGNSCGQATNNFSLLIGGIVGVLISLFFFYVGLKIQQGQDKLQRGIAKLTELYVIRTGLLNLKDVYNGIYSDKYKVDPTDESREKYLRLLHDDYITDAEVVSIRDQARAHRIPAEPASSTRPPETREQGWYLAGKHQQDCEDCKAIAKRIGEFLDKNPNPMQRL